MDGWPELILRVYTPDAGELRELRGIQEATVVSKIYTVSVVAVVGATHERVP
jgi:hypothetical protein